MRQPLQHSMILTKLTRTGQALMQLDSRGYVDIETARHLVAAGLQRRSAFVSKSGTSLPESSRASA